MKLNEAKHILKKAGCLLESENKYFTNAEVKELVDEIAAIGINIDKSGNVKHIHTSPDSFDGDEYRSRWGTHLGSIIKVDNNKWQAQIYDMKLDSGLKLIPKDDYGPKFLKNLDADEIVKTLTKYNDIVEYLQSAKNNILKKCEIRFNIDTNDDD